MKKEELSKTIIISATIIVVALIIFFALKPTNLTNTINVQGTATISAMPDLIGIYFNVETSGKTATEAKDANSEIVDQMKTNLLALGLEEKEITTQNFNVYQDYEWINNQRKENGYKATHSIKIEILTEQTKKIGQIIDAGVNAGAGISYINFELTQESQNTYKAEAMKLAAQDARIKADSTASGLNKKIGKLVSVSVNDFGYYPWGVFEARASGISEDIAEEAKVQTTNIQPSEQEISASVSAVFKLR